MSASSGRSPRSTVLPTTLARSLPKNAVAFLPTVTTSISAPSSFHFLMDATAALKALVFNPPHSPRSVDSTM